MIVGRDIKGFLKKFFERSNAQAFLLTGETEDMENLLVEYLSNGQESLFDLKKYENTSLKIEEAREIQFLANQSAISGSKIFVIKNSNMAPDAQATLLKTLEEPYPGTYFILSGINESSLSSPLLSRLTIFKRLIIEREKIGALKIGLDEVAKRAESREEALRMFERMEAWALEKIQNINPETSRGIAYFVEDLYEAKARFFEKTYPPRMLLEHLVISKFYLES